ncbi:MAG: hypothetical protein JO138_01650 [Acidobacteriaceae bacterium]|nr:hypothetical protein [Acidobacteriaceae bacterium]
MPLATGMSDSHSCGGIYRCLLDTLLQILEAAGVEVLLVNARHVKNVPGRKTDVADCQWIQYLHSVGLLKASFRPAQEICAIRSLLRIATALQAWLVSMFCICKRRSIR